MHRNTLVEKLTTVFRDVFNDQNLVLDNDTTAEKVGAWDSLSHMLMITQVENSFSVKFRLREISKLKNVGSLNELIESKLA